MAASGGKPRHLVITARPRRPSRARANEQHPWQVHQGLLERLIGRLSDDVQQKTERKFRFKNKLLSLDATPIPVSLSDFDGAKCRRSEGVVKLPRVLDYGG
jgi:hypothetical protein